MALLAYLRDLEECGRADPDSRTQRQSMQLESPNRKVLREIARAQREFLAPHLLDALFGQQAHLPFAAGVRIANDAVLFAQLGNRNRCLPRSRPLTDTYG
jgi:hypothetical protein